MAEPRSWTDRAAIVVHMRRQWDSGAVLAEIAGAPSIFPYRVRMTKPTTGDLSARYDDVRTWTRELLAVTGVRVEVATAGTRSIGRNEIPSAVWIDDIDGAAELLDERAALAEFRSIVAVTRGRMPALVRWLAAQPLAGVALGGQWDRLLSVVAWLHANPEPGIYVRQVDIAGVDTKFIERHASDIASLFDTLTESPSTGTGTATGMGTATGDFTRRFGFRATPPTIRIRSLDPTLVLVPRIGDRPVTLTVDDAAALTGIARVFITENYVNFLAFPAARGSAVVFGEGFDVGKVASLPWIAGVPVHYWGDIDTHGFAILDLLRAAVPHTASMLMDHATLHAHELQWGTEPTQVRRDLLHLNAAERALYDDLRDNRIRPNLRFEQELTSFGLVERTVATLTDDRTYPTKNRA